MKLKPFVCDTQTVFLWARGWFKWEVEWDRRGFLLGSRISLTHIKVNHDDLNDSYNLLNGMMFMIVIILLIKTKAGSMISV
mgnify:FL=1